MSRHIPEEDWQIFRKVYPIAVERFSQQIIKELEDIMLQENQTSHERYGQIYKLIKDHDREMGNIFNEYRRSTALLHLHLIHSRGLITSEEIKEFSEETQKRINSLC